MQESNREIIKKLLTQIKGSNPYFAVSTLETCRNRLICSDVNSLNIDDAWFYCIAGLKTNNGSATRNEAGTNSIIAIDVDDSDIRTPENLEDRLAKLRQKMESVKSKGRWVKPTAIINSGGGFHILWFLSEEVNTERAADIITRAINVFKTDANCKDAGTRLLRLPNHINDKLATKGYKRDTSVVFFDETIKVTPELLESKWPAIEKEINPKDLINVSDLSKIDQGGVANSVLYKKAQDMARSRVPMEETFKLLADIWLKHGTPLAEIENTIKSAYRSRIVDPSEEYGKKYELKFRDIQFKMNNSSTIQAAITAYKEMGELIRELGTTKDEVIIKELRESKPEACERLNIGFPVLYDRFPLYKKKTYVLTAGAKTGKTTTLSILTNTISSHGYNVLYVTNEMSWQEISNKIMCAHAGLSILDLEHGTIPDSVLQDAKNKLPENIYVHELTHNQGPADIKKIIDELRQRNIQIDFMVIDSYERLTSKANSFQDMAATFQELMKITRENNICTFAIVNQNRSGNKPGATSVGNIGFSFEPVKLADCTIVSQIRYDTSEIVWSYPMTRFALAPLDNKLSVFMKIDNMNTITSIQARIDMEGF